MQDRPFEDLGAHLRQVREQIGYSVSDVASMIGISKYYLYEVERGDKRPSQLLSFALSTVYCVPVDTLDPAVSFKGIPGFEGRRLEDIL